MVCVHTICFIKNAPCDSASKSQQHAAAVLLCILCSIDPACRSGTHPAPAGADGCHADAPRLEGRISHLHLCSVQHRRLAHVVDQVFRAHVVTGRHLRGQKRFNVRVAYVRVA